jgi:intracellular septation protein|tara:strand:- start:266 stop:820 length:555 start_codon:yes stop_codon:yes gene_type:complete
VNKSFIKFATDFGPLLVFFTVYYKSNKDLISAIPPLIIATIIAVSLVYILEKKIPYVPIIGALLISIFGGLTVYFKNPVFLYLKPTIINILFAIILWGGKSFFKRNLLKIFFKNTIKLEEIGWDKLMYRWIVFFILLAVLNEIIWRTQTEEIWVNFKVWGILPLTFLFTAFQVPLIQKYKQNEE